MAWDLAQGWTVHQIPSPLPPLFSGDRMVVFGLLKPSENASQDGKNEVRLHGTLGKDEKMEHLITFLTPRTTSACDTNIESNSSFFVHRLAAKTFIKVKQDDISGIYNGEQEFEEAKTSIISVSKSANVVSKFTSFVAVDKDNHQPVSGPLQRQVVPSFADQDMGYMCNLKSYGLVGASLDSACLGSSAYQKKGGFGFMSRPKSASVLKKKSKKSAGLFSFPSLFGSAARPAPEREEERVKKSSRRRAKAFNAQADLACQAPSCSPLDAFLHSPPEAASQKKKEASAVLSLISLQKASGAWDLTDQLVSLCSTSRDALITACPTEIAVGTAEGKLLWATALALVLLMGKFSDQKDEWEMIAEKGKKWMKKNLPAAVKYDNVLKSAATVVGVQI